MKKSQVAFILNSYSDLKIINNKINKNSKIYVFNSLKSEKRDKYNFKFDDFYCNKSNYKKYNIFKDFVCKSWFKIDQKNKKNEEKLKLIGNILFGRLHSDFTDKLRIAISLKKISKNSSKIYYSSKLPNSFKHTINYFKNCKQFKTTKEVPEYLLSVTKRSAYHFTPNIHKLSNTARKLQFFFPIKKDVLVFPDPYYENLFKKRSDTLYLNSKNPFKAFYFKENVNRNFFFKEKDLDKNLLKNALIIYLKKKNFKIDNIIIRIFYDCLVKNYLDGIKYFNWTFDNYKELLDHYNPKKIILSNTISFNYLIANYLAKKRNILTILSFDGLETVYNPINVLFDKKDFIYDKLVVYGSADYKLNLKHKINKKNLILSRLPITDFLIKDLNKEYDFIVMSYQPRTYNLESRWDKKIFHVIEIVKLLNELKYKNIALKMKPDTKNLNNEINYLNYLIKKKKLNCKILTGNFFDLIGKTNNVIGGISTALWESSFIDVPYYIYEPIDMGLLDYQIKKSAIFKMHEVPRKLSVLKSNLLNKNFYKANKKIMFNGKKLDQIIL